MATNNTIQYTISAKDQASAVFAQVATSAKGVGKSIADTFANTREATEKMQAAVSKMTTVVSSGFGAMTGDFSKLGSLFGALPGPIGVVGQAVGDTLGRMLQDTVDAAEGFRKLSERTGASVEFLSGFTEAADDMFVSSQAVNASLTIFAKKLGGAEDAMDGSGTTATDFSRKLADLGIVSGNMEEALGQVADRFADMQDGSEKTALAVQLFGKQGIELIPILNKGSSGIAEMSKAAKDMGLVMTGETVEAVKELKKNQDELNDTFAGVERTIIRAVIPAMNSFTKEMKDNSTITFQIVEALYPFARLLNIAAERNKVLAREQDAANSATMRGVDAYNEISSQMSKGETVMKDYAEQIMRTQARQSIFNKDLSVANTAMGEFPEWALGVETGAQKVSAAVAPAAATAYDLALALMKTNDAAGATPKMLDAAAKATAAYRIALAPAGAMTGEKSERDKAREEFVLQQAYAAVTQAIIDQTIGVQGLTKAQGEQEKAAIAAQAKAYKPAKDNKLQVGLSAKQAQDAIEKVDEAMAHYSVTTGISEAQGAKLFLGLKTGALDAEQVLKDLSSKGSYAVRQIYDGVKDVDGILGTLAATPRTIQLHSRWDDYEATLNKIDSLNKTVTVSVITTTSGSGVDQEAPQAGDYATRAKGGPVKKSRPYLVGEQGPEMFVPYASGYIVPNAQTPYIDPGQRAASASGGTFNVNNPGIVINSANGAAIAQQIARGNANVARRARARASFVG